MILMLAGLHGVLLVTLLTFAYSRAVFYRFYLPSLLIAWVGFAAYEAYTRSHCTGECNIRVDLVFIYPWLGFVTICVIAYLIKGQNAGQPEEEP